MTSGENDTPQHRVALLSEREREILRRMTGLNTLVDVADDLGIHYETARTHIKNARRKLGGVTALNAARMLATAEGRNPNAVTPVARVIPLPPRSPLFEAPFRKKGALGNDLTIARRLLWIVLIAIAVAIGFGMLAVGFRTLGDLVAGFR